MQFIDLLNKMSDNSSVRLHCFEDVRAQFAATVSVMKELVKPSIKYGSVSEIRAVSSDFFDVFVDQREDVKKGNSDNG